MPDPNQKRKPLHSDVMERIQTEVMLGKSPPEKESVAEKEFRGRMQGTTNRLSGPGLDLEIPFEFLDLDNLPEALPPVKGKWQELVTKVDGVPIKRRRDGSIVK